MAMTKVKGLQLWCARRVEGYRDVEVRDMTSSWKSGLAFCALIHKYRPDLIDYDALSKENIFENNNLAFQVAEQELGIPALLEAQDMVDIRVPDKLSVVTYVSQYHNYFRDHTPVGGPGISVKQVSSSPGKKSQTVQPAPAQTAVKRFAPTNDKNASNATRKSEEQKKTSTLGDKCVICQNKVYLLERQIENGKLYHRSCFRHSELSPTAKVFKSSKGFPSEEFTSQAKVRKTDDGPSWARSGGKNEETSLQSEHSRQLFSNQPVSSQPFNSERLLDKLKSRMEVDESEPVVPKYKQNRPLIFQKQTESQQQDKQVKTTKPSTATQQSEKHDAGRLSIATNSQQTTDKTYLHGGETDSTKSKRSDLTNKAVVPTANLRKFGEKTKLKDEKMDTLETFGTKLKHVSPPESFLTRKVNDNQNKLPSTRPLSPPKFGKQLLASNDKSRLKENLPSPDSPPPLPTSAPPALAKTNFSSSNSDNKVSKTSITLSTTSASETTPTSTTRVTLATASPKLTSTSTTSNISTKSTVTTASKFTTSVSSIISTSPSSATKSTVTTSSKAPASSFLDKPQNKGIVKTVTTTTTNVLKTTTTSSGPSKQTRTYFAEGRSDSPSEAKTAMNKASHHKPGSEPVAVLVVPTEKGIGDKRVLGGLLASLANVRQNVNEEGKSNAPNVDKPLPLAKSKGEKTSHLNKPSTAVSETKVGEFKPSDVKGEKEKQTFSFVSGKLGVFQKDETVGPHSKEEPKSKSLQKTNAVSDSGLKTTSNLSANDEKSWVKNKQTDLKATHAKNHTNYLDVKKSEDSRNKLLQDSKISDSESVPSWKKVTPKKETVIVPGSKLPDNKFKKDAAKEERDKDVPAWKKKIQDENEREKSKSTDLLLENKSKPSSNEDNDTPAWMKALEKRKAEKSRPKSADILLLEKREERADMNTRLGQKEESSSRERSKSVALQENDSSQESSWQLEAQRRLAQNKATFVDPEKGKSPEGPPKPKRTAPEKKPRTLITHINDEVPTPVTRQKIPARPPPARPPPARPTSPPVTMRQMKKISLNNQFDFDSSGSAMDRQDKQSPLKTPVRPPPPRGGSSQTETPSPGRASPAVIQKQLNDIDVKLTELELRGRQLEDSIRSVGTTEEEDDMMIEWFRLINSKNELVRQEADLIYMSKQQNLEDEQEDIDEMLRFLVNIPESKKTPLQKKREEDLLEKKLNIVNARSSIIDSIDEDRIRYEEEDQDIAVMLEGKGFLQGKQSKVVKKKPNTPRKDTFVSYTDSSWKSGH